MSDNIRHNSTLSPVQQQVALALAAGQSISAAARQAGIHRSTIHNWTKNDPAFRAEFERVREERLNDIYDKVYELDVLAFDTIRQLIEDPKTPASVRLRATLAILQRGVDVTKLWTVSQLPLPKFEPEIDSTPEPPPATADTPRNAPCPCGSNQKYKRCCGKAAPPVLGARAA